MCSGSDRRTATCHTERNPQDFHFSRSEVRSSAEDGTVLLLHYITDFREKQRIFYAGGRPRCDKTRPSLPGRAGFVSFSFFAGRSIHEAVARGVQDLLRLFAEFLFQEDIIRVVGRDCENRNFVFREDGGDF